MSEPMNPILYGICFLALLVIANLLKPYFKSPRR